MQTYLDLEREKLRSLDKNTVKKIITNAEKSLMHFMRSKAKVNCFRQKDNHYQSYTALPVCSDSSPQQIFDYKKLEAEIGHEQRKMKQVNRIKNPLIEYSLRQVAKEENSFDNKSTHWE